MLSDEIRKAPFLRILFPLIGGIVLGRNVGFPPGTEWICIGIGCLCLFLSLLKGQHTLLPLLLIYFFLGTILGREPESGDIDESWIRARIYSEIRSSGNGKRASIDKICFLEGDSWKQVRGKASVYFDDTLKLAECKPGMTLLARGKLSGFSPSKNPDQFDYGRYQRGKGILYQVYLRKCWISESDGRKSLKIRSLLFRRKLIDLLEEGIGDPGQAAVLDALLLGYRGNLDSIQEENFARSGTMHILAVSGLHVGILYFLPALLLKRLKSIPCLWISCNILLFILLWMYAFITGLSSSVIRAVCMCCIYGLGMMSKRKINSFHVLSLAAFLMIIFRPPVVFELGFQLSFAAVTGILLMYQRLLKLFPFRGWVGRRISQMMAVSLAAQLSTLPLAIAFFNQFAPISLLANLLVIPAATLILYAGGIFFLFAGAGIPATLPAFILSILSRCLEDFTRLTAGIPGAYFDGLSLSSGMVPVLYIAGIFILLYLKYLRTRQLVIFLIFMVLLIGGSGIQEFRKLNHRGAYVFALTGETAVGFVKGRQSALFMPDRQGIEELPYEIEPFFRNRKLQPEILSVQSELPFLWQRRIHSPWMEADYFLFMDKRILILRRWDIPFTENIPLLKTDILVLCNNPQVDILQIIRYSQPTLIVADGSNHPWISRQYESDCREAGVQFHSTRTVGCFEIE